MRIEGEGISHKGNVREHNEDFFITDNDLNLYIVCDGVGGCNSGEVASKLSAETCYRSIVKNKSLIDDYFCLGNNDSSITQLIQEAFMEACQTVCTKASQNTDLHGMSTTMTAILFLNNRAIIGHVGDSRLYLIRNNQVYQVTNDHTLGQDMRDRFEMAEAEIKSKKFDSILTRCIGAYHSVEIETLIFDILPGDQFVMCSDGLSNYLRQPIELIPMVEEDETAECLKTLIDFALKRGGQDNITTILIETKLEESMYMGFSNDRCELLNNLEMLTDIYLFKNLNFIRLNRILNKCDSFEFFKDEIVIDNENPGGLYIVLYGSIAVRKQGKPVRTVTQGNYFGEQSLMYNKIDTCTYQAEEDSMLIFLSSSNFKLLCRNHPKFGVRLLENFVLGL